MVLEQLNKSLTDHPRCAKYSDFGFRMILFGRHYGPLAFKFFNSNESQFGLVSLVRIPAQGHNSRGNSTNSTEGVFVSDNS
jgi:hypothetical protein